MAVTLSRGHKSRTFASSLSNHLGRALLRGSNVPKSSTSAMPLRPGSTGARTAGGQEPKVVAVATLVGLLAPSACGRQPSNTVPTAHIESHHLFVPAARAMVGA